jgi:hypothetical protein
VAGSWLARPPASSETRVACAAKAAATSTMPGPLIATLEKS